MKIEINLALTSNRKERNKQVELKENYQLAYKSFMQVSAKSFNSTQPREK